VIPKSLFHRILIVITIFGGLLEPAGFLLRSISSPYSTHILILGYLLLIFGFLSLALENLILKWRSQFTYKEVCLTSMFGALGFYLMTPLTSYLFRGPGLSLLFLIPAFFSFLLALFSIIMGIRFLKKR